MVKGIKKTWSFNWSYWKLDPKNDSGLFKFQLETLPNLNLCSWDKREAYYNSVDWISLSWKII